MFEPGRLPDLTASKGSVDLSGAEGKGGCAVGNSTHTYTIDACVSKGPGSRCEADGRVSRQLTVHVSSSDTPFCVPAPLRTLLHSGNVQHMDTVTNVCAHVSCDSLLHMIVIAHAISVRGQTVWCPTHICSVFKHISLHAGLWSSVLLVQPGLGSSREATHEEQLLGVE